MNELFTMAICGRMLNSWIRVLAVVVSLLPLRLSAEDAPPQAVADEVVLLSLRDAAVLAVDGTNTAPVDYALQRVAEEEGRSLPEIYLRGRYSYEDSSIVSLSDQASLGVGLEVQRLGLDLVLQYDLLQFLDSEVRIKAANADERAARSRLELSKRRRVLRAVEAYFSSWTARQQLKALRELLQRQLVYLGELRQRQRRGSVPMVEVLREESDAESTRGEILAIEREAAVAELQLRQATGLPSRLSLALVFQPVELDLSFIERSGLEGLLQAAQAKNPRLMAARAAVESAHWQTETARRADFPDLDLLASYGRHREELHNGIDYDSTDDRLVLFLNLKVPLFDGGVRRAKTAQARALERTKLWEQRELERELKALVESEYWSFVGQDRRNRSFERQVDLADEEFRQASTRRVAGAGVSAEAVDAFERYTRFRVVHSSSRADTYRHGIRLALAVGQNPFVLAGVAPAKATATNQALRQAPKSQVSVSAATPPVTKPADQSAVAGPDQMANIAKRTDAAAARPAPAKGDPIEGLPFGINLLSTRKPISGAALPWSTPLEDYRVYKTQFRHQGQTWYRVRLGFFPDRSAAERVRSALAADYPKAWTTSITEAERRASRRWILKRDD